MNRRVYPSRSAWARSIRAQAAWKVITHIARTRRPTSSSARSRISPAALLVNVIARISFGLARVGGDQVGDPVGQHAGLARPGAGQDQQRPVAVGDGLALGLVEPGEQGFELGGGVCHGTDPTVAGAVVVAVWDSFRSWRTSSPISGRPARGSPSAPRACGSSLSASPPTWARLPIDLPEREPDPETHLTDAPREELAALLAHARRDQLRLGLVPDPAQARAAARATSRSPAALTARFADHGPWTATALAEIDAAEIAAALDQDPDHELMALFAAVAQRPRRDTSAPSTAAASRTWSTPRAARRWPSCELLGGWESLRRHLALRRRSRSRSSSAPRSPPPTCPAPAWPRFATSTG